MRKEIERVEKLYSIYENAKTELTNKVRSVCDFNAVVTYCDGDGHLVLNEDTAAVASMSCLDGKSRHNKLTAEEHEKHCI